jgi:hypothetical protein
VKIIYIIWGLLPLALYLIAIRAAMRRTVNAAGKEYPGEYLQQAIFCTIALVLAILVYEYWFDNLVVFFGYGDTDVRVIGWLIYPLILFLLGAVQHRFLKKKEDELEADAKKRKRDWMFRKMGK